MVVCTYSQVYIVFVWIVDVHIANMLLKHIVGPSWLFKLLDFFTTPLVPPPVLSFVGRLPVCVFKLLTSTGCTLCSKWWWFPVECRP